MLTKYTWSSSLEQLRALQLPREELPSPHWNRHATPFTTHLHTRGSKLKMASPAPDSGLPLAAPFTSTTTAGEFSDGPCVRCLALLTSWIPEDGVPPLCLEGEDSCRLPIHHIPRGWFAPQPIKLTQTVWSSRYAGMLAMQAARKELLGTRTPAQELESCAPTLQGEEPRSCELQSETPLVSFRMLSDPAE